MFPLVDDWLSVRLAEVVPDSPGLDRQPSREALGDLLDSDVRTRNGLPAWGLTRAHDRASRVAFAAFAPALRAGQTINVPAGVTFSSMWRRLEGSEDRDGARRFTPVRDVIAAVAQDVGGIEVREIARLLGKVPSVTMIGVTTSTITTDANARRDARRRIAHGRTILAGLGAWPWAHAPDGKLGIRWHGRSEFIEPLDEWRERCYARHMAAAARSADPVPPAASRPAA